MRIRYGFVREVYGSLFTIQEQGHICFEPFDFPRWQEQVIHSMELMPAEVRSEVMNWAGALRDELIESGEIEPCASYAALLVHAHSDGRSLSMNQWLH